MISKEELDRLSHLDAFASFMGEVYSMRESAIQQLHDKPDSGVQQVAGRILQCDDILRMGGWEKINQLRVRD